MNIKEIEKLLLSIAEQRLKLIPGAYDLFLWHHVWGSALPPHLILAGSVGSSTLWPGVINSQHAFHRYAIEYVDSWAEKHIIAHVEPLAPRVAPLLPARSGDISAPSVELKALRKAGPFELKPPKAPDELATFSDLIAYRTANPAAPWCVEMLRLLSDEEARRKSRPGAAGVRQSLAAGLGVSVARVGDLIRKHKNTTPRTTWR